MRAEIYVEGGGPPDRLDAVTSSCQVRPGRQQVPSDACGGGGDARNDFLDAHAVAGDEYYVALLIDSESCREHRQAGLRSDEVHRAATSRELSLEERAAEQGELSGPFLPSAHRWWPPAPTSWLRSAGPGGERRAHRPALRGAQPGPGLHALPPGGRRGPPQGHLPAPRRHLAADPGRGPRLRRPRRAHPWRAGPPRRAGGRRPGTGRRAVRTGPRRRPRRGQAVAGGVPGAHRRGRRAGAKAAARRRRGGRPDVGPLSGCPRQTPVPAGCGGPDTA